MARASGRFASSKLGRNLALGSFPCLCVVLIVCHSLSVERADAAPGSGNTTFQFVDSLECPTGAGPAGLAAGDLNHDGSQDLVAVNSTDNTVSVLLGKGDGTFAAHVDYATGKGPSSVALADLNGDGKLDLVVTNSTDNTISVLKGNGDGTFQAHADRAANGSPQSIAVADFNHDQKLDLVLVNPPANSSQGNISVLIGKGDGTFNNPVQYAAAVGTNSLTVADLNGDGTPDVVATNSDTSFVTTGAVSVFIGKGDGTFGAASTYNFGHGAASVAVADFNGDGKVDLAVSAFDKNTIPGPDSLAIFLGNGDGTFGQSNEFATGGAGGQIIASDFDGDGHIDLAIASPTTNTVGVLLGGGDGTFPSHMTFGAGNSPRSLVAGDFNGDGHIDLVSPDFDSNSVGLLLGNGNGSFQARIDYAVSEQPLSIAVADFNGDGKPDLATADQYGEGVSVLLGSGDGTFQGFTTYATSFQPAAVVAGDFNGDGKADVATINFSPNCVSVLLGKGDGSFQPHVDYPVIQVPRSLAIGDFNDDGKPDLVVVGDGGSGAAEVLTNKGDGTFLPMPDLGFSGSAVAVADFTGDSIDDLATISGSSINILIGFHVSVSYSDGSTPTALAVGDFNGDGKADLVVVNGGNNQSISILLGNGNGTFQPHVDYSMGSSPGNVVVGDFNGDGKTDIAVTTPNDLSVFTNKGDGTFLPRVDYATGFGTAGVAVGDFDLDGKLDVATTNVLTSPLSYVGAYLPGSVSVLLNGAGAIVTMHSSENPSAIGAPVTLTANVKAAVPGALAPSGSVTLQDGSTTLGTTALTGGGAVFSIPALASGIHPIAGQYSGDQNFRPSTSVLHQAVIAPDFSLTSSALAPASVSAGQTATATVTITSLAGFSGAVSLACSVSPGGGEAPTCSLAPATIQSSAGPSATSTLTISTTAQHTRFAPNEFSEPGRRVAALWFPLSGFLLAAVLLAKGQGSKQTWLTCLLACALVGLLGTQMACGGSQGSPPGGGGGGTTAGSYVINIQGTSGATQHSASVNLSVR